MMPYGKAWPVDTGVFFIPFSAAMLIAGFGALTAGWKTPWRYRWLLCVPSIGILVLLVLTVMAFWPMNSALFYHGIVFASQLRSFVHLRNMTPLTSDYLLVNVVRFEECGRPALGDQMAIPALHHPVVFFEPA